MILVTGGAGFIGSTLIARLNAAGRDDIVIVDDLTDGRKFQQLKSLKFHSYFDRDDVMTPIETFTFDKVFHCGAESSTTETDGKKVMKYNYDFTRHLFSNVRTVHPIVYLSSASVYGNSAPNIDPLNLYAYSKVLAEEWINRSQIDAYILRPFNVYGEREQFKDYQASPITKFRAQLEENGRLGLFEGSDKVARDFVWVEDVVSVMLNIDDDCYPGTYDVGTGVATTFKAIGDAMVSRFGGYVLTVSIPENLKGQYQFHTKANLASYMDSGIKLPVFRDVLNHIAEMV